jgi:hypothetical protein
MHGEHIWDCDAFGLLCSRLDSGLIILSVSRTHDHSRYGSDIIPLGQIFIARSFLDPLIVKMEPLVSEHDLPPPIATNIPNAECGFRIPEFQVSNIVQSKLNPTHTLRSAQGALEALVPCSTNPAFDRRFQKFPRWNSLLPDHPPHRITNYSIP